MEKTAILTDTNSGIYPEEAKEHGIYLIPMIFYVDGKEYTETVNLDWDTFDQYILDGKDVQTVQPPIADLGKMWEDLLQDYDKVVYIPMSRALSGTYETAVLLAEAFDGKVLIVPSTRISATQESSVWHAKRLADEGVDAADIVKELTDNDLNARIWITVDTLDYLKKSGRVSSLTALAGNVLNIKPIIQIMGSKLEPIENIRGRKKAKRRMLELLHQEVADFESKYPKEELHIYIAYSTVTDEANEWAETIESEFPGYHVKVVRLAMSICCHTGPGTIGTGVVHDRW